MEFKFSKSVHFYYATVMVVLMVMVGIGITHYWTNGPANMENISSVFEATLKVDDLKKRKDIANIYSLIGNDRVRDAVKVLERLELDINSLNKVQDLEDFTSLKKDLVTSKSSLNKLLSHPELSSVMLVLGNKISNFENFVIQNQWRTLTRMARRMRAKVTPGRVRSHGFFTYNKIRSLNQSLQNDIKIMINVTTGSVLSRQEKQMILTKVKTLKTETNMLSQYVSELKTFRKDYVSLKKNYKNWFSKIGPEISYKRIQFEKNSQNFLFSLIGFLGFLVLTFSAGIVVYKWNTGSSQKKVEDIVSKTIKDGMIPIQSKLDIQFSKKFEEEFAKSREYVHKRMSFGTVFQEAMPFSSVLMDSNLNVVWANPLFYEHWHLEEYKTKDESISWDFLQRFTNLGDHDPVLSALNENVAGIYQIQVKTRQNEDSLPYEMYVSPVEYAGQSRIMIFFYPLRSLEETLHNQTKSLVGPVSRTLDALTANSFSAEFQEKIVNDYDIAGINEVYEKFTKYNEFVSQQKNGLLSEIERLENDLYDQMKLVGDMETIHDEKRNISGAVVQRFGEAKDSIVSIVELRSEIETLYQGTMTTVNSLFQDEVALLSQAREVSQVLGESTAAFANVSAAKTEFKQLKGHIEQYKGRIMQLTNQTLIFQNNNDNSLKLEQSLSKLKMEVQGFEQVLASFSKIATSLDVSLSKVDLILQGTTIPNLDNLSARFDEARDRIESDMFNMGRLSRNGQVKDEEMITALKGMYQTFQQSRQKLKDLEYLSEHNKVDMQPNAIEKDKSEFNIDAEIRV